jgi:SAM-dependent methyltransferase
MGCPVCFSEKVLLVNTYSSLGYVFIACQDCGVIFADPMKAGTKEWYENHAFYAAPGEPKDNKPFYEEQFLTQTLRSGQNRLLNIGCGYNQFLRKLESAGYEVTGVDLNEQVIRFTKEKLGIKKAYAVSVDDFIVSHSTDKFDFIVFFEVLEHLENPGEFLLSLKKILSPKGRIVFSMPNRNRLLPQTHWADYPPHHLTRWNRQAVRRALEKNGFIVEKSLISPVSAEQLLYALGFDFWTGQLGKNTDYGKKPLFISGVYRFLFRIRVIFYNLLAIGLRPLFPGKGTYLYTEAVSNKTNETGS